MQRTYLIADSTNAANVLLPGNTNSLEGGNGLVGIALFGITIRLVRGGILLASLLALDVEAFHNLLAQTDQMIVEGLGPILQRGEHVPVRLGHVDGGPVQGGVDGAARIGPVRHVVRGRNGVVGQVGWVVRGDGLAHVGPLPVLGGPEGLDGGGRGGSYGGGLGGAGTAGGGRGSFGRHGVDGRGSSAPSEVVALAGRRGDHGTAGGIVLALAEAGTGVDGPGRAGLDLHAGGIKVLAKGGAVALEAQVVQIGNVLVEGVSLPGFGQLLRRYV